MTGRPAVPFRVPGPTRAPRPDEPGGPGGLRGLVARWTGHPAAPPLGLLAAGIAGSFWVYRNDPHQSGHWLPRCPFNWATGLLCPACGATRMVYDLLHADPVRAFHENALLFVSSPVILWFAGRWLVDGLRGRRRPVRMGPRASYAVLAVAVLWAVVRNVV
ncbi:DUF2752 domain-containing protein [Streptomyces sp. CA-111067]|uniref:DUF2752 domain-containing protein n=1 Tax=Streptomyces sp. CA-111067 TaxID=3240046 RepID=UPI003D98D77C